MDKDNRNPPTSQADHNTQTRNYEAEQATLQGIIRDNGTGELLEQISPILPEYNRFVFGVHREIYQAMQSLFVQGKPVDYVQLATELHETGKGGLVDKLNELIADAPDFILPAQTIAAAERVQEAYVKRNSLNGIEKAIEQVYRSNGSLATDLRQLAEIATNAANWTEREKGSESPWKPKTLAQALVPLPPRVWVVDKLFTRPSLSVVYANPGQLKTMVLLDLALSVATGQGWLQGRPGGNPIAPFSVTQCPVLWIDQDSGEDEITRRIAAIAKAKGADDRTPFYYLSFPMPAFQADSKEAVDLLVNHALEVGAGLIVIDTLNAISGNAGENDPAMATVMAGLRQVSERARAATVSIHHPSKDNWRNLRGHSSINGAVDLALAVKRDGPDAVDIAFEATKSRRAPVKPFGAYFAFTQDENDPNELATAQFFGTGRPQPRLDDMSAVDKARHYIRLIEPNKMSQSAIVDEVKAYGPGRNTTLKALEVMAADGDILIGEGGKDNAKLYSLV